MLEDFGSVGVKVSVGMDANAAVGIVQWRVLNKLRHVEPDMLWIQEQYARRLLPLRMVPGSRNPSGMMTNNVDQAHIEMFHDILNLRFDMGRADIAQNLHSTGEKIEQPQSASRSSIEAHWPCVLLLPTLYIKLPRCCGERQLVQPR